MRCGKNSRQATIGCERGKAVIKTCMICNLEKTIHCTQEELNLWQGGMLIQNAMPNVSVDERELLISGVCGTCFDEMFDEAES